MQLIRSLWAYPAQMRGAVATIGNFDGVHRGHQAVLAQMRAAAADLDAPTLVILFEPQPAEYFLGAKAPPRLMSLREKILALADYGIDAVLRLRFDAALAQMPAQDFIERILLAGIGLRQVVIGDDFRFGRDRAGNFDLLQRAGMGHGFFVSPTQSFLLHGQRVSSTAVRQALARQELGAVTQLLGRPYRVCGRVQHGDRLGHSLGFPTANLSLVRRSTPLAGIYAVRVSGIADAPLPGVASVGTRPTVGGTQRLLEVHVFDFDGDLYGQRIAVEFMSWLRPEWRFDSLETLTAQMRRDAERARAELAT